MISVNSTGIFIKQDNDTKIKVTPSRIFNIVNIYNNNDHSLSNEVKSIQLFMNNNIGIIRKDGDILYVDTITGPNKFIQSKYFKVFVYELCDSLTCGSTLYDEMYVSQLLLILIKNTSDNDNAIKRLLKISMPHITKTKSCELIEVSDVENEILHHGVKTRNIKQTLKS